MDNEVDQKPVNLSAYKTYLTDKMWPKMWFINRGGDLDMNVEDAWAQGYTGKGVKVRLSHLVTYSEGPTNIVRGCVTKTASLATFDHFP